MIINAGTVALTLIVVSVAFCFGLKFVRKFALQIARENHDAVAAMDRADEEQRLRQERAADAAAATAFAKVKPILTTTTTSSSAASTGSGSGTAKAMAKDGGRTGLGAVE